MMTLHDYAVGTAELKKIPQKIYFVSKTKKYFKNLKSQ